MKHLKLFEERKKSKKSIDAAIESLKDALTEITDNRKVLFYPLYEESEIEILIRLNNHYTEFQEQYNDWNLTKIEDTKKSFNEISKIIDLINEGLERSQINYDAKRSGLLIDNKACINWEDDGGEDGEDCNTIEFKIKLI